MERPDLAAAGAGLWESMTEGIEYRPDEAAVLETACRVADQVAELEAVLADQPLLSTGSQGQTIVHPVVPELRQQRALLASLLSRLDVPDASGVPGEWDNLSASERARKAAGARWMRGA